MKRLACLLFLLTVISARAEHVFVEAESFAQRGGWQLDTQFIEIMGSPYLLAHGLGEPVKDAETTVNFSRTGKYHVFIRTIDWVARWNATGTPGKFQVLIDGKPLTETFGTLGADWFWQPGGEVEITKMQATVALHDLTGFDGRCDAVIFTDDPNYMPPNDSTPLAEWRRTLLKIPEKPIETGPFDVVVVGGGYAGMSAAISAARMGCKVALIQNRGVLGGNGSSEIRVWAMGGTRRGLYPHLGEIVEEFMDKAKMSPGTFEEFGDAKKEALVRAETKIQLFLNTHAFAVETQNNSIVAVKTLNTMTSEVRRFIAPLFVDCTGHGSIGALAGADLTIKEEGHLGMSNMWRWKQADTPQTFPPVPWALDLTLKDFPYPQRFHAQWFWESGFNKHPIKDLEYTRDWNLRAVFGAFNAMKNGEEKKEHEKAKLEWVAYVGGTRESRQLFGDVILSRDDIDKKKPFPDGCVPTTWDIDLHYPKEQYAKKFPNDAFISKAIFDQAVDRNHGYPVPYRCFYSRNINNLFMAGRCVSVTHEALGTVRVMKTGGMMGEVVGKAVSICVKNQCSPREVHEKYLDELKALMLIPGKSRRETVNEIPRVPDGATLPPRDVAGIDPATLQGIVIDEKDAKFNGNWKSSTGLKGFIGEHYLYASPGAAASARFEFKVTISGKYDVLVAHQPHENRATNTPVTVESADGSKTISVNQRVAAPLEGFVSLGSFRFEANKQYSVTISNTKADGIVHADAVIIRATE